MQTPTPAPLYINATIKRSGPAMTITGDVNGVPQVLTGVARVQFICEEAFALDRTGTVLARLS